MSMLEKFVFHSPGTMKTLEERMGSIKSLRELIAGGVAKHKAKPKGILDILKKVQDAEKLPVNRGFTGEKLIGNGAETGVWASGDHAIKRLMAFDKQAANGQSRRRAMRSKFLSESNDSAAPEYMIDTGKGRYLVQKRADSILGDHHEGLDNIMNYENTINDVWRNLGKDDVHAFDAYGHNIGMFDGKPKLIDTGHASINKPMTALDRLKMRSGLIQKGRKKPWLEY